MIFRWISQLCVFFFGKALLGELIFTFTLSYVVLCVAVSSITKAGSCLAFDRMHDAALSNRPKLHPSVTDSGQWAFPLYTDMTLKKNWLHIKREGCIFIRGSRFVNGQSSFHVSEYPILSRQLTSSDLQSAFVLLLVASLWVMFLEDL